MNNLFYQLPMLSAVSDNTAFRQALSSAVTVLIVLLALVAVIAVVLEVMRFRSRRPNQRRFLRTLTIPVYLVAAIVLVFTIYCGNRLSNLDDIHIEQPSSSTDASSYVPESSVPASSSVPPTQPPTLPDPSFPAAPQKTDKSDPANWNIKWEINVNGSFVDSYQRPANIHFGMADDYFTLPQTE